MCDISTIDIEGPILMPLLTKLLNFRLAGWRPRELTDKRA